MELEEPYSAQLGKPYFEPCSVMLSGDSTSANSSACWAPGPAPVQRELATLVEAGIVTRTVEGRQTYFQANADSPVFAELRALIRKTFGAVEVLRNALQPLTGSIRLAFIYGSVAAGDEKAGSDIDLLVVGDKISLDDVVFALFALSEAQQIIGEESGASRSRFRGEADQ